jgi:8-oxo-dGTP pyrophosphatase MutT (NUDIX family)
MAAVERAASMPLVRHFTATGFVVHDGRLALHWHQKVRAWLPPGGHIEENEDPVEAVVREIEEETGLRAEVVASAPRLGLEYPVPVPPPFTIMVEDIHDPDRGYHQHIDMIYMCRPAGPVGPLREGWLWVAKDRLAEGAPLEGGGGQPVPPPEDVRVLARYAFEAIEGV